MFVCVCMSVCMDGCVPGALKDEKRVSDPLELELQLVVSHLTEQNPIL